jgi:hypothetical protein
MVNRLALALYINSQVNVRENRRGNQELTIHAEKLGSQDEWKQYKNTTQYVLDTTTCNEHK